MIQVCFQPQGIYMKLDVPGLAEGRPTLMPGDKMTATSPVSFSSTPQYEGIIHEVRINSTISSDRN